MAAILLLNDKNITVNFKEFILGNGVLTSAAGFTIGLASAHFVKGLVEDMVLPTFYKIFAFVLRTFGKATSLKLFNSILKGNYDIRISKVFQEMVTWLLIIILAFVTLDSVRKAISKIPSNHVKQESA